MSNKSLKYCIYGVSDSKNSEFYKCEMLNYIDRVRVPDNKNFGILCVFIWIDMEFNTKEYGIPEY